MGKPRILIIPRGSKGSIILAGLLAKAALHENCVIEERSDTDVVADDDSEKLLKVKKKPKHEYPFWARKHK